MATRSAIAARVAGAVERIERAANTIGSRFGLEVEAVPRTRYREMQRVLELEHYAGLLEQIEEKSRGTVMGTLEQVAAPAPAEQVIPADLPPVKTAKPKPKRKR